MNASMTKFLLIIIVLIHGTQGFTPQAYNRLCSSSRTASPRHVSHFRLQNSPPKSIESTSNEIPTRLYAVKKDNILEKAVLLLLAYILSTFLTTPELQQECKQYLKLSMTFKDFCSITKLLLRKSNGDIDALQKRIVKLLHSLVPSKVRQFFKDSYFSTPKRLCEQSSEWIHRFGLISWLIGSEVERFDIEIVNPVSLQVENWNSGLKVMQCRYLLESGCKSTCLNICKLPTQAFFSEMGLPLSMTPDYADCSCKFEFGKAALPKELDPVFSTPCYLGCSLAARKGVDRMDLIKCS